MSRAALEYIGQAGLGYTFDALDKTKKNAYAESIKMLVWVIISSILSFTAQPIVLTHERPQRPTYLKLLVLRELSPYIIKFGSPAFRRKLAEWIPLQSFQDAIRIIDIMDATSRDIYVKKKEALAQGDAEVLKQVGQGKDIMSVLRK